jgi:hypothetical protein
VHGDMERGLMQWGRREERLLIKRLIMCCNQYNNG